MNLTELHASLNRQKGGFDRWAHSRLNAVESIRQNHEVEMKKANVEYEELKENKQKYVHLPRTFADTTTLHAEKEDRTPANRERPKSPPLSSLLFVS